MRTATTAYIGLGSNVGTRRETIHQALTLLEEFNGISLVKLSSLIETAPVGGPAGQSYYLNGVAEIQCHTSAEMLLEVLHLVEERLGRVRREKWGSRTIDLDILLFGDEIIDTPDLHVPHRLMHTRDFVMLGMAEIAPQVVHPQLGRTMREILRALQGK